MFLFFQISRLLSDDRFADFTIIAGPERKEFRVHKAIISNNSGYFKRLCSSRSSRDGSFKENLDNTVELPEFECDMMEKIISYLYGFDIESEYLSKTVTEAAKLFKYADYFDMPYLSRETFREICLRLNSKKNWDSENKEDYKTVKEVVEIVLKVFREPWMHAKIDKSAKWNGTVQNFLEGVKKTGILPKLLKDQEVSSLLTGNPSWIQATMECCVAMECHVQ